MSFDRDLLITESATMAATPPGAPGISNHESFHETSPDDAA